jgi:hypothetical protein
LLWQRSWGLGHHDSYCCAGPNCDGSEYEGISGRDEDREESVYEEGWDERFEDDGNEGELVGTNLHKMVITEEGGSDGYNNKKEVWRQYSFAAQSPIHPAGYLMGKLFFYEQVSGKLIVPFREQAF